MNNNDTNQKKWIALSALILFLLGGGGYQLMKNRQSRQGAVEPQVSPTPVVGIENGESPSAQVSGGGMNVARTGQSPSAPATGKGGATAMIPVPGAGPAGSLSVTPGTGAPAPAAPVQESCISIAFRHKSLPNHSDEETCSQHKNWLKLKHKDVNPKSVCVRVNGTPVHYLSVKGRSDELIFGSVAGPKAKVSVRYCVGKTSDCAQLKEDCTVPKDEFMEAIGGSTGDKGDPRLGQWDPSSKSESEADVMAKLDGAVKKELETNDELNGRAPAGEMFKDWIAENEGLACGTQQASK